MILLANLLDNNFQSRYYKLPIATHAVKESPCDSAIPFVLNHYHKEFEIIGIISGSCEIIIDHTVYSAEKNDLVLIPPYSLHWGSALPGETFSHFCFCFDLSLLQNEFWEKQFETGSLDVERILHHNGNGIEELYRIALNVYRQCEERLTGWEYVVKGLLLQLFGLLEQKQKIFSAIRGDKRATFGLSVLNFLGENYSRNISSSDVAARMSYNQSYFCRKFHDTFGLSFQQYLCQYRLSKARLFLAQNDISIEEAAQRAGFNHVGYFIRQFHAVYGCTPKQFQKRQARLSDFRSYYPGHSASIENIQ